MTIATAFALLQVAALPLDDLPLDRDRFEKRAKKTHASIAEQFPQPSQALMAQLTTPFGDLDFSADLWEGAPRSPAERFTTEVGPSRPSAPTDIGRASFGFAFRF